MILGDLAGSTGAATIDGTGSNFKPPDSRQCRLRRPDHLQQRLYVNVGDSFVGRFGGSSGTVLVTGQNSLWTTGGILFVGSAGTGMVTLANGGIANANTGILGAVAGSSGTMTVTVTVRHSTRPGMPD